MTYYSNCSSFMRMVIGGVLLPLLLVILIYMDGLNSLLKTCIDWEFGTIWNINLSRPFMQSESPMLGHIYLWQWTTLPPTSDVSVDQNNTNCQLSRFPIHQSLCSTSNRHLATHWVVGGWWSDVAMPQLHTMPARFKQDTVKPAFSSHPWEGKYGLYREVYTL